MMVEWLFLAVPWGCLKFVIVVFPDHTHLLFFIIYLNLEAPIPKTVVLLLSADLFLISFDKFCNPKSDFYGSMLFATILTFTLVNNVSKYMNPMT